MCPEVAALVLSAPSLRSRWDVNGGELPVPRTAEGGVIGAGLSGGRRRGDGVGGGGERRV